MGEDGAKNYERIMNRKDEPTPIATPITLPAGDLSFITDENLYKEIIKYLDKTFPDKKSDLSAKLEFEDGVMKGSNNYTAIAVDMYFKSINSKYRIARQKDLETNLQMFRHHYEFSGLVLRSIKKPNKDKAKYLYDQIKGRDSKIKFPIMTDLRGLHLDSNLNFNLTDESEYKTADCLNWGSGKSYSQTDDFGLPAVKDKNSNRQIWTTDDGLVGLCLDGSLGLGSFYDDLAHSSDIGRVVVAKLAGGK